MLDETKFLEQKEKKYYFILNQKKKLIFIFIFFIYNLLFYYYFIHINMNFQDLSIIFRIHNTLLPINCLAITANMRWPMGDRCQRQSKAPWINEFPRYRLSILYSDAKDILYYIMNKLPTINNYCTMQRGISFPYCPKNTVI